MSARTVSLSVMWDRVCSSRRECCSKTERMKRLRLLLIHVAGRMNLNNCVMGLRLCTDAAALKRMQKVREVFDLATQATPSKALGGRGGQVMVAQGVWKPYYRMRRWRSVSG